VNAFNEYQWTFVDDWRPVDVWTSPSKGKNTSIILKCANFLSPDEAREVAQMLIEAAKVAES
jgi:hypothetical protein